MNGKQVKRWVVVSFVICFVLLMLPTIWSTIGEETIDGSAATIESRTGSTGIASLILGLLIVMIYSDEIISWFDRKGS